MSKYSTPSPIQILFLAMLLLAPDLVVAKVYMVRKGDTLSAVSRRYDVTALEIARFNGISLGETLSIGQKLRIPPHARQLSTYTVQAGDSMETIANRFDVSAAKLSKHNGIRNPDLILIGQTLSIPDQVDQAQTAAVHSAPQPSPATATTSIVHTRPADPPAPRKAQPAGQPSLQNFSSLWRHLDRTPVKPRRWRYIVIHHSASRAGTSEGIDRYHREGRHMENGLAYHFVIGNGNGMSHGQIDVGDRWNRQLDGGHLASDHLNSESIGICLIGNFDNAPPSAKQLDSLSQLTHYLMHRTRLSKDAVRTHRAINTKPTVCPGRYFPEQRFLAKL
ncbi:MAG: LysM peptidoglycan-binding domain-containing protein [Verrucomicrobia bacterium]|nr:LysM peptidoglycan-binding domain-containing protein [Verrucomicrobiota bacterium]MDA1085860.1 LysM peptidoglycan-binding domain-containing protein [Verrucomicrobiota bacterium]